MGGMTIMALADQRPELFGDPGRRRRAASRRPPGRLSEVTFGLPALVMPVTRRVLPYVTRGMRARPRVFERGRRLGTDLAFLATRRAAFGSGDVPPSVVEFVETMIARCPVDVIGEFYDTFTDHDKLKALDALRPVEVLLLVGSRDLVTPEDHTRAMAEFVPHAELVVAEGAGHMVVLEQPALVTDRLRALVAAPRPARRHEGPAGRGCARGRRPPRRPAGRGTSSPGRARGCTACPELAATRTTVVVGRGARAVRGCSCSARRRAPTRTRRGCRSSAAAASCSTCCSPRSAATAPARRCSTPSSAGRRPTARRGRRSRRAAAGWTERQLALVDPDLVVTLGLSATRWFLGPVALGAVRGQVHEVGGRRVLPTYHPSAALRFGPRGEPRRLLREDLALAVADR